ncbi:MAG: hypothetical protein GVY17_12735 [Cyanobacteria bacterium]|jgi:hypothetical protein|nr:hypothetical protein [Cyanobacteria bacterium GSL.Bin21]
MKTDRLELFTSPYQVGGGLGFNHPTYVTRQADTELYKGLKKGEFCYVFNARQMGKSSLRLQAMHRLRQDGIACVSIDLTNIGTGNVTPEQWYRGLCFELLRKFQLRKQINLKQWWRELINLSPVQQFSRFIEEIILSRIQSEMIVICFDEIDSVLGLNFPTDDFFALIRFFYNQRWENPIYQRLCFALFGVATPPNLMQDKQRTPFNLGKAIQLQGFRLEEAQPLAQGLCPKVADPNAALKVILGWTGGQPFLTQKLCQLVVLNADYIAVGEEAVKISEIARSRMIQHWEANDEPEHLRTIRDRLLYDQQRTVRRLSLYKEILTSPVSTLLHHRPYFPKEIPTGIPTDNSIEQTELLLSGLTVKENGFITVCNPIYEEVFNLSWIDQQLLAVRPYNTRLQSWLKSGCQDQSPLLKGSSLIRAQNWADGKSLSDLDYQFLAASQLYVNAESLGSKQNYAIKKSSHSVAKNKSLKLVTAFILGAACITFLGLAWQNLNQEKQEAKIAEVKAYNLLAESYLSSEQPLNAIAATLKAMKELQAIETSPPMTEHSKLLLERAIAQLSQGNNQEVTGNLSVLTQQGCQQIKTYLEAHPEQLERAQGKLYFLQEENICDNLVGTQFLTD